MKKQKNISEDEMIAVFLRAEINSNRFGDHILERLKKYNSHRGIIDNPNLEDRLENKYRRQILKEYRGFGDNKFLFHNFPTSVEWTRVVLTKNDLNSIKYINYNYWVELSQKTRYAKNAVDTIERGIEVYKVSNRGFAEAAEAVRQGVIFPEMILVSTGTGDDPVVLEGHLRLTAYLLAKDKSPETLEAIIGYSPDFIKWGLY